MKKVNIQQLCDLIEERKEELFDLLSGLIKINSENLFDGGKEEECARYIHKLCTELGLESDIYSPMDIEGFSEHPDYMPGKNLENRYNVVARMPGEEDRDELMIMSHIDTVPVGDLNNWNFDPFAGIIEDGKILGRGACDDKYGIATALFILKLLKENGFKPKANLLFAGYCDEEFGGSHGALAAVLKYPCERIVNMDCKEDQIWHCGSGGAEVKYFYHTKNLVDSAEAAARAIPIILDTIKEFSEKRRCELEENRFYKGTIIPDTSLRYMGIRAGNNGMDLGRGEIYFVFYTDKTKEEIDAEFDALHKKISAKLEPIGIIGDGFKYNTRFFHYVYTEPDSEDIRLMLEAAKDVGGTVPDVCGSCLSDLSVISKYGNSKAFAYGSGRNFGDIGGAHQPNEFIECDKLVEFTKTIGAYILKVLG